MSDEHLAAIVVPDVAPATWPASRQLLAMVNALGSPPVTLLVVPHFHRGTRARDSREFIDAITARVARGDEAALHGLFHVDDAPAPRDPGAFVRRCVMTRGEAEFAAIAEGDARDRLAEGIGLFESMRWPLHGFVPPAWQLNKATRAAIDRCGHRFSYVPVRGGIFRLPQWELEPTANFCYSPDRAWRRGMSRATIAWESHRARHRRLLRLSLHPLDAAFPVAMRHWQSLLGGALRERRAVTKYQAMTASAALPCYAPTSTGLGGKLSGT